MVALSNSIERPAAALPTGRSRLLRKFRRHRMGVVGVIIVLVYIATALGAPWLAPWAPDAVDLRNVAKPPSLAHPFGTDQFGRDMLSRTIYGARTSLVLGFCVVGIATLFGMFFGVLAGYYRGRVERLVTFMTDVMMTLPSIVTALAVVTILGPGLDTTIIAIAIASLPRIVRVARSAVLQVREMDYIQSSRSLGASDRAILLHHVVPNALSPVIVQGSLLMAEAVLVAAGLGFLGVGVKPPMAEWGQMLAESRALLRSAPHISIFPGLAIIFLVLGLNLLGDGLRDTLDVRTR